MAVEALNALVFLAAYAVIFAFHFVQQRKEFERCPEKASRFSKLPVQYRLACPFLVIPLFATALTVSLNKLGLALILCWPAALASLVVAEAACVQWYRKNGLL